MPKAYKLSLVILVLLLAVGLRVAFVGSSVKHLNVSGDESIAALLGMGITQSSDSPVMQAKQHPRGIFGRFPLLFMAQPYLFPVDSYFAAAFIRWLPNNAFGIRFTPSLLGLLTVLFSIIILLRRGALRETWPGVLLVLFPSSYLLLLQGAYGLPGYPSSMFLSALAIFIAQEHNRSSRRTAMLAALAGLTAGIACSGTMLMLPLLGAVGVMVSLNTSWRRALRSAPSFLGGALLGLAPYYVAKHAYPGAHNAVTQMVPVTEAINRLHTPTLSFTLPAAMGIRSPIVPDSLETVSLFPEGAESAFAYVWFIIAAMATGICIFCFVQRLIRNRWPSIESIDLFAGLSWVSILLFVLSSRWGSHEFRYLMPLAWSFPFLVADLYRRSKKIPRVILGFAACGLAIVNMATASLIMGYWAGEEFDGYFTDVRPAIEYMQEKGIRHCYASYFDCYAINYMSDEKIVCSQPHNERFYGWPLPYKELVDAATNVAYAMGPSHRFRPEHLDRDLEILGVTSHKAVCGKFNVHTDFMPKQPREELVLPEASLSITASHCSEAAALLSDGDRLTRWHAHHLQEKGMWIEVRLPSKMPVARVNLFYDHYPYDNAHAIDILAADDDEWRPITNAVPFVMHPFEFINGHPVYGSQFQTIRLDSVPTDAVRIEIAQPHEGRDWTIGEIEISVTPTEEDPQP